MEAAVGIVLSPALQVLFDRLASPLVQMASDLFDYDDGSFQSLQHALVRAQATLDVAEEQQLTNKAAKLWLLDLKKAVCNAQDVLDIFVASETLNNEIDNDPFGFEVLIPGILIPLSRSRKLTRIMLQQLERTVTEGFRMFNIREPTQLLPSIVDRGSMKRETSSFVKDTEIHGRKEEREELFKLLISSDAKQVEGGYAACVSIIGHGGIGKTTLAQFAYNDKRVVQHFDVMMWIFVSVDFNITKIMKGIIESLTKSKCEITGIDELQSMVWNSLHKKKFLLVLDDVWTEDPDDWEKLTPLFREGVDGCKIVVTTRSRKIPLMMDSSISFQLDGLPFGDCLALFNQRAFGRGEEEKYPHLVLIGKQIVKKCGGLPLAVKSLGSVLRFKREEPHWLFMQNSELWQLDVCQQRVFPALMLSYLYLPSHLRQCFAFCSLFPKYYEFKKEKLIHLWMAEGFVLQEGSKRLEDIGEEYFADLLWMSFFQEVEISDTDGVIGYRMVDVIHDLARYVAGKEFVTLEGDIPPHSLSEIRHSSIVYTYGEIRIPEALYEAKHLRTLLFIGEFGLSSNMGNMLTDFVYLRLLDLNGCDVSSLPVALGKLICLRYLDLSYTPIDMLPFRARGLVSLQTLNLIGCYNLRYLPSLGMMTCLRHLNLTGCEQLTGMPAGIERLHQLQTLPLYVAGHRGDNLSALEQLNLYGKLNLTHLERVRRAVEVKAAGLMMKKNLDSLGLYWGAYQRSSQDVDKSLGIVPKHREAVGYPPSVVAGTTRVSATRQLQLSQEILNSLQPPKNMKKLVINGYPGIRFAAWALPEYVIAVEIVNCKNCEHLPALGNLLLLKTLYLHGMHGVRRIGTEFYGDGADVRFSSLEELTLSEFPNLEEWSSTNNVNSFPSLRKLTVKRCPKLAHIPSPQSLQHLELQDCNPTLTSVGSLSLLSVLVLENIPDLLTLPEGFIASACLSSLKILSCPKLRSLPIGNLTALKSLTIRWCEELSLPQTLQNLKALESLEISNCRSIISMPDGWIGGLSLLRTLSIESCTNLTSLSSSLEKLALLEHLTIMFCPNLGSFPEGVQHLSSLRSLVLLGNPWFDSLPEGLQNVGTLHCLEIGSCPNLTALPEWFEGLDSLRSLTISDCPGLQLLPPGLKILTKLQHLSIQECPELEERCKQGSGGDWMKIAHVPHKFIGPPQARQSGEASTSGS